MTYKQFQELGFNLTEKEINKIEKEVQGLYVQAYKDISERIKLQHLKVLSSVDTADYYNEMLKYNRLDILLKDISKDYRGYIRQVGNKTTSALKMGMANNYYRQQFATSWAPVPAKFTALPKSLIEVAAVGTENTVSEITTAIAKKFGEGVEYMPQVGSLTALINDNATKEIGQIRRAIIAGLRNGDGYARTAAAVRGVIGRKLVEDGVEKITGAMASATRIIRTESTRVLNAASYANSRQLEAQDVDIYRVWDAVLDMRTRDRHAELDGQRENKDGLFSISGETARYPGDFSKVGLNVNCRCTTVEIVPGLEPDIRSARDPVTGEIEDFSYKNFTQWAEEKGLSYKNGRWQ